MLLTVVRLSSILFYFDLGKHVFHYNTKLLWIGVSLNGISYSRTNTRFNLKFFDKVYNDGFIIILSS